MSGHSFRQNLRLPILILILPLTLGILALLFIFGGRYQQVLSSLGTMRLTTKNWPTANAAFLQNEPSYRRHFAYYKVLPGQTVAGLALHFGVPQQELASLNPGSIVAGTTIKVPPIEQPFTPFGAPRNLSAAAVTMYQESVYVANTSPENPQVLLTIPALMGLTRQYNAIAQTGPKEFELLRPIYIKGNIRLDITGDTVTKLLLMSAKDYNITALTVWDADALIDGTTLTTFDPATGEPDNNYADGRSFLRAYGDSRLDIIHSQLTYLGMGLSQIKGQPIASTVPFTSQGGIYGVSWRIPDGSYGQDLVTGWVQDSLFSHNYIGGFTFGASGMKFERSVFSYNQVYGLDPHDDSNNALIENNTFANNGKHGFIMSKRCDYNIVENNVSYGNVLHGFMLHEQSAFNLVANNTAYNNFDDYIIFDSDFNELRDNKAYDAREDGIRVDTRAANTYLVGNIIRGAKHGIYIYNQTQNVYISGNQIQETEEVLQTDNASDILFVNNTIPRLGFKLGPKDRIVFGPNAIGASFQKN